MLRLSGTGIFLSSEGSIRERNTDDTPRLRKKSCRAYGLGGTLNQRLLFRPVFLLPLRPPLRPSRRTRPAMSRASGSDECISFPASESNRLDGFLTISPQPPSNKPSRDYMTEFVY